MDVLRLEAPHVAAGLSAVVHCVLPEPKQRTMARPICGIHVRAAAGGITIEATDGHRAARYTFAQFNVPDGSGVVDVPLAKSIAESAAKAGPGTVDVPCHPDSAEHLGRLYPDLDPILHRALEGKRGDVHTILPVDELRAALAMAAKFKEGKIHPVKLSVVKGKVVLETHPANDLGFMEHIFAGAQTQGVTTKPVGFNGVYLKDAAKLARDTVTLCLHGPLEPGVVLLKSIPELVQVVMPLRLDW
jgi:DNA polymerase III sliding clamp (beta) subunit (PCNA family)